MCKEFLSLHIGQAGVQSSHALWELVCIEHGVGSDGMLQGKYCEGYTGENIEAMYYEIKNSRYVPRAILIDLEPTVVDEVRTGCYRQMWNPSNIINQKEDAASNYARGFYTSGKSFIAIVLDRINREVERCENLSAFEIVHSFAGGTGSGLTALILETISELYGKKFKFSLGVFPSPTLSEIMVEAYNAILHTNTTLQNEDCVVVFDNESLFKTSLLKLNVSKPTFSLMNRLISQMFSSISLSHRYRFFGSQHTDVTELLTNLVPYPRIHFPIMSYSPLVSFTQRNHEQFNCFRLTNDVFLDDSHMLRCSLKGSKFMSCCMLYRGMISPKQVIDAIARIKNSRNVQFVDWCPTGFKIGLNTCPPIQIPQCEQAVGDNALCMISSNTAIRDCWNVLVRKFDMLIAKRAFVHWYVSEGLEEGEFLDSRENLKSLLLDYDELSCDNFDDDNSDDVIPEVKVQTNINNKNFNALKSKKQRGTTVQKYLQPYKDQLWNNSTFIEIDYDDYSVPEKTKKINFGKSKKSRRAVSKTKARLPSSNPNEYIIIKPEEMCKSKCVSKHTRQKTKTISNKKYIEMSPYNIDHIENPTKSRFTYTKKKILPETLALNIRSTDIITSQSYVLSSGEERMRNNNKESSIEISSSAGSFMSKSSHRGDVRHNKKSKGDRRILDQLSYNKIYTKNIDFVELCNSLGRNLENMCASDTKLSMGQSHTRTMRIKRHSSISSLSRDEKVLCVTKEPVKKLESLTDIQTNMSINFRKRNFVVCNMGMVVCEPMAHCEEGLPSSIIAE